MIFQGGFSTKYAGVGTKTSRDHGWSSAHKLNRRTGLIEQSLILGKLDGTWVGPEVGGWKHTGAVNRRHRRSVGKGKKKTRGGVGF